MINYLYADRIDKYKKIAIYVATHKKVEYNNIKLSEMPCYKLIYSGAANAIDTFGYLRDDMVNNVKVDSLSNFNSILNEFDVLYWIWKYAKEDYVGLNHYRRYWIKENRSINEKNILSEDDMRIYLSEYDMLVSVPPIYLNGYNSKDVLKHPADEKLFTKTWDAFVSAIEEISPNYLDSFLKMMQGNILIPCNMFMTKKEIFARYCEWLFPILLYVIDRVNLDEYTGYNKRIIAMFGERMLTVYLLKNNLKIKYLNYIVLDDSKFKIGASNKETDAHRM